MVHVFMPVHWLTEFGGLHENVFDSASAYIAEGWKCTVMAPASKVTRRLVSAGVRVIENDMADTIHAAELAINQDRYDIVHAHPFAAREVGETVAKRQCIPLILTIHGQYIDQISEATSVVICVAPSIVSFLQERLHLGSTRTELISNAVDTSVFFPSRSKIQNARKKVLICSRIDPDKVILLQCLSELASACRLQQLMVDFIVAGENLYGSTEEFRSAFNGEDGCVRVNWLGWIDNRHQLAQLFNEADLAIASGRGAMEAFACGCPTIAVASRGYVGLLNSLNISAALDTNFGGVETPRTKFTRARAWEDFKEALRPDFNFDNAAREKMLESVDYTVVRGAITAVVTRTLNGFQV